MLIAYPFSFLFFQEDNMEMSIGNYRMNFSISKEKKNRLKAEYKFTEYGNNYYDIWLDNEKVQSNVLEWDLQEVMDKYSHKYSIRFITW